MTEPRSSFRHPIALIRGMWAARRGADASHHQRDDFDLDDVAWPDDDPSQQALLDMQEALVETLHEDPSVKGISFKSTAPNVVEVYLDPWSEASAQWVRDVCSPREAQLKAGRAPWLDNRDEGFDWD